jgi:hypothetical protein
MTFTKAMIEVLDEDQPPQNWPGRAIEVQVNPSEYTLTKGAQIAEIGIPGIDSPVLQFIRGQNEKLTLDLFFDTTRSGMGESPVVDVTTMTDQIYQLVKIQPETHAPPRIRFTWGQGLTFQAIVESIQRKFTVFNPAGIPLRATLTVTFREYKTLEQQLTELNLKSSDQSKSVVTQRGDTLSGLAFREYRDPGAWRAIADANRSVLPDPRRLEPGTVLLIPPLERGRPVVGR